MKKNILSLVVALFIISSLSIVQARVYKPHSRVNDPVLVTQLHQQMALMESHFMKMEEASTDSGFDYAVILKAVEQMTATRKTIRQIVSDKAWDKPLAELSLQLQKVKTAAAKQDSASLRKGVDGIYNSCFHCHAANGPKY